MLIGTIHNILGAFMVATLRQFTVENAISITWNQTHDLKLGLLECVSPTDLTVLSTQCCSIVTNHYDYLWGDAVTCHLCDG